MEAASTRLSDRTVQVLRALLDTKDGVFTVVAVAEATDIQAQAVAAILARLADLDWLVRKRGKGVSYQFTEFGREGARESIRLADSAPDHVWTVDELRREVAAGRQPQVLLDTVLGSLIPRQEGG